MIPRETGQKEETQAPSSVFSPATYLFHSVSFENRFQSSLGFAILPSGLIILKSTAQANFSAPDHSRPQKLPSNAVQRVRGSPSHDSKKASFGSPLHNKPHLQWGQANRSEGCLPQAKETCHPHPLLSYLPPSSPNL